MVSPVRCQQWDYSDPLYMTLSESRESKEGTSGYSPVFHKTPIR